jgi:hypothetical protein
MSPGHRFCELWALAEGRLGGKGSVTYIGAAYPGGFSGYDPRKAPDGSRHPAITLQREGPPPQPQWEPDLVTRPLEDACILAHEFGHLLSDEREERSAAYEAGLAVCYAYGGSGGRPPTPEERALVVAEEERAWAYGQETLADLGVTDWAEFDAMRDKRLEEYRSFGSGVGGRVFGGASFPFELDAR